MVVSALVLSTRNEDELTKIFITDHAARRATAVDPLPINEKCTDP
jgi:hypothetical protein